jgi:hypothetical protein
MVSHLCSTLMAVRSSVLYRPAPGTQADGAVAIPNTVLTLREETAQLWADSILINQEALAQLKQSWFYLTQSKGPGKCKLILCSEHLLTACSY